MKTIQKKKLSMKLISVFKKQQLKLDKYKTIMSTVTNLPIGRQPCWKCIPFWHDGNHANKKTKFEND